MSMPRVPPDPNSLLKIGAVARRAGVSPDAIRYYERLGLVEPARRSDGGYRLFRPAVHERLTFIRKAQALGLSLEEVREVLEISDSGAAPCRQVREALAQRLEEVDRRLGDLRALRRTLVSALRRAESRVEGPGICGIIENARTEPTNEEEA
jgi:DNA-binding transcriptional MerR regulator